MGESFVQLPPDSTGKKARSRQRTVGANTVEEQYFVAQSERVRSFAGHATSFRIPARALASEPLFAIHNATGSAVLVAVRRLSVEVDSIVAKIVLSPYLRTYRFTALPTGGTAIAKAGPDTADTSNASVTVYEDASADGTNSATALAFTPAPAKAMWQQVVPRWHTLAGFQAQPPMNLLPDDAVLNEEEPHILRALQGIGIRMEAAAALVAGDFHFYVKAAWDEYTLP